MAAIRPDLVTAFADAYERVLPGFAFAKTAEGLTEAGWFGEPEQWRFDWAKSYTTGEWLEQVPTVGGHNLTPPDKLGEFGGLLPGIAAAVDVAGGSFTMNYAAVVVTAVRTGAG